MKVVQASGMEKLKHDYSTKDYSTLSKVGPGVSFNAFTRNQQPEDQDPQRCSTLHSPNSECQTQHDITQSKLQVPNSGMERT